MSLPSDRWTVYTNCRMSKIDAELKEKLAPFGASRSERFRFAYDLAFAVICGDRTNAMVSAILGAVPQVKSKTFAHPVLATESPKPKIGSHFRIDGFQSRHVGVR